jgi:hypothetical protein
MGVARLLLSLNEQPLLDVRTQAGAAQYLVELVAGIYDECAVNVVPPPFHVRVHAGEWACH